MSENSPLPASRLKKVCAGLVRVAPVAALLATLLIIPAYLHDAKVALSSPTMTLNCAAAVHEEASNERGEPAKDEELQTWIREYTAALAGHRELVEHFRTVLDEGDLSYLQSSAENGAAAVPEEIQAILDKLGDAASSDAAKSAIDDITLRLADLHKKIADAVGRQKLRGHILFNLETDSAVRCREKAHEKIQELERISVELDGMIGENPPTERFTLEQCDTLIRKVTEACRTSRVAYVFTYTLARTPRYTVLRNRFLAVQKRAYLSTKSLSESSAFDDPNHKEAYTTAKDLLGEYSESMLRRLQNLP